MVEQYSLVELARRFRAAPPEGWSNGWEFDERRWATNTIVAENRTRADYERLSELFGLPVHSDKDIMRNRAPWYAGRPDDHPYVLLRRGRLDQLTQQVIERLPHIMELVEDGLPTGFREYHKRQEN